MAISKAQLMQHARAHIELDKIALICKPKVRTMPRKGKMNIPVKDQIRGIKKAIASRRTPKQLVPSLRKRLRNLKKIR
jgi:hypothetical protein